jgi:hypothetical protein
MATYKSDFTPARNELNSLWDKYGENVYFLFTEYEYSTFTSDIDINYRFMFAKFFDQIRNLIPLTKSSLIKLAESSYDYAFKAYQKRTSIPVSEIFIKIMKKCEIDYIKSLSKFKKSKIKPELEKSKLGKYAFPQDRLKNDVPYEFDTKIESDLLTNINMHFLGSSKLSKENAKLIQSFLKTGKYSDIFKEPDCEKVYRRMLVPTSWLQKILNKSNIELPNKGNINMNFLYTPLKNFGGSSWSTSTKFVNSWRPYAAAADSDVKVTLMANVSDNKWKFVIGKNGLYKLNIPSDFTEQHEAVGLGTIKVSKIEWDII